MKTGLKWLVARKGPLAIGINQGGLFTRAMPQSASPDIQFHFATLSACFLKGVVPQWELTDIDKAMLQFMGRQLLGLVLIVASRSSRCRCPNQSTGNDKMAITYLKKVARTPDTESVVMRISCAMLKA